MSNQEKTTTVTAEDIAQDISTSLLKALAFMVPLRAADEGLKGNESEIIISALGMAILKFAKAHQIDVVQLLRSKDQFVAIGLNDGNSGRAGAQKTIELVDSLADMVKNGGKCSCPGCSKETEPSTNEQTTREILAEIAMEQAQ